MGLHRTAATPPATAVPLARSTLTAGATPAYTVGWNPACRLPSVVSNRACGAISPIIGGAIGAAGDIHLAGGVPSAARCLAALRLAQPDMPMHMPLTTAIAVAWWPPHPLMQGLDVDETPVPHVR